jgi:hypothetical protein
MDEASDLRFGESPAIRTWHHFLNYNPLPSIIELHSFQMSGGLFILEIDMGG